MAEPITTTQYAAKLLNEYGFYLIILLIIAAFATYTYIQRKKEQKILAQIMQQNQNSQPTTDQTILQEATTDYDDIQQTEDVLFRLMQQHKALETKKRVAENELKQISNDLDQTKKLYETHHKRYREQQLKERGFA